MSLSRKQARFTIAIGKLISYATIKGYSLTFGDAYRDPRVHGTFGDKSSYSARNSLHKIRLAVDFNLFIKGEFIQDGNNPAWIVLGEYWESLDQEASWGGHFNDANHFSFTHWGCK